MILTVASYKGGVGKTMTAIHVAAFLYGRQPSTVLVDGDPNRSASRWVERGSLPFPVVDERQLYRIARERTYEHMVIDTQARPTDDDMAALAKGCDLLILPVTPDQMALEAMLDTRAALLKLNALNHKVLLTIVPPIPSREGAEARKLLEQNNVPVFKSFVTRAACFQKAAEKGSPVYTIDEPRAARGWEEYQAVGQEILKWTSSKEA